MNYAIICQHQKLKRLERHKAQCMDCHEIIECNHTQTCPYHLLIESDGIWNGSPPVYCKLCGIMIKNLSGQWIFGINDFPTLTNR